MFEKYGEFDSAEEMNRAAEKLLTEGKTDELLAMAAENGLDCEDVEDYIDGCVENFTTPAMAALGKLEAEAKDIRLEGILADWKDTIAELCTDEKMSAAVRKKGKSLASCMAGLLAYAFENKVRVSDKIVDLTKIKHNGKTEQMRKPLYLGIPNRAEVKKLAKEYYLGEES